MTFPIAPWRQGGRALGIAVLCGWVQLAACDGGAPGAPPDSDGDSGRPDTGADSAPDTSPDSGGDTTRDTTDSTADSGGDSTDTGDTGPPLPDVEAGTPVTLPLPTTAGLPVVTGFTVNARVHPHGLPCTWTVEVGPTSGYGDTLEARALPGVLGAFFAEDWDEGAGGWLAGIGAAQLAHQPDGGPDGSGFVRYTDDGPYGDDTNHYDGIGAIHLGLYGYSGHFDPGLPTAEPLWLGGGFPDLRGARFALSLRGVGWDARGTELGSWIQASRDPTAVDRVPEELRFPNWAFTGDPLTGHLASGEWERAEWTLRNRSSDWTFAGTYGGRLTYDYGELDSMLGSVDIDLFPVQILYVDIFDEPSGAIDYDQLEIVYRQRSVLAPTNGGALEAAPADSTGAEALTDGWRFGGGREWASGERPTGPQELRFGFARPVTLSSVLIHNSVEYPSRGVVVEVSTDGGGEWHEVLRDELPATHALGPNHLFVHANPYDIDDDGVARWTTLYPEPVDTLRVLVESGWGEERWGIGEIEAFGTGALEATEDDWYDLTRDVYVAPGAWHYRVCATSEAGTTCGPDQEVVVPEAG